MPSFKCIIALVLLVTSQISHGALASDGDFKENIAHDVHDVLNGHVLDLIRHKNNGLERIQSLPAFMPTIEVTLSEVRKSLDQDDPPMNYWLYAPFILNDLAMKTQVSPPLNSLRIQQSVHSDISALLKRYWLYRQYEAPLVLMYDALGLWTPEDYWYVRTNLIRTNNMKMNQPRLDLIMPHLSDDRKKDIDRIICRVQLLSERDWARPE